jgi:hypothetical protein
MRYFLLFYLAINLAACVSDSGVPPESLYETTQYQAPTDSGRVLLGTYYVDIDSSIFVSYAPGNPATLTANTVYFPHDRRYLYLLRSPFIYSDTANFKVDGNTGLLASTDVASTEDVGTALVDMIKIAQTFAPFHAVKRTGCNQAASKQFRASEIIDKTSKTVGCVKVILRVADGPQTSYSADPYANPYFAGFSVYEPTPVEIIVAMADDKTETPIAAPKVVTVYKYRHIENPERDFLTSRHETFAMTNGALTEHDLTADSDIKGFFGFITIPITSALPSK